MRICHIIAIAAGMFLAGCTTTQSSGRLDLPGNAKLVGGGLLIEWTAPVKGTAILAETTSGKIVETRSLEEGDTFSFEPMKADNMTLLNSMFGDIDNKGSDGLSRFPADARFALYFAPL